MSIESYIPEIPELKEYYEASEKDFHNLVLYIEGKIPAWIPIFEYGNDDDDDDD
jgi:hypothetical protein